MKKLALLIPLLLLVVSAWAVASAVEYAPYTGVDYTKAGLPADRLAALNKARQMVTVKWTATHTFPAWCSSGGSYNYVTATDGTTSTSFLAGKTYTGIPYSMKDHSYDDVNWYNLVANGQATTSKMTATYYSHGKSTTAHGSDCSYFVYLAIRAAVGSKITYQVTTSMMSGSDYTKLGGISQMIPGDLFLNASHVMMYVGRSGNNYAVFECTAGGSKCAYNVYSASSLSGYGCYRYNGFSNTVASTVALDLNGLLDAEEYWGLSDYGTCDVYINGSLVANDVNDYYADWPVGTRYELRDIRAVGRHAYMGCTQGALSGTLSGSGVYSVRLSFATRGTPISGSGSQVLPNGDYIIRSPVNMEKIWFMDIVGSDSHAASGTKVAMYSNENGVTLPSFDVWHIEYSGGYYYINQYNSDSMLSVKGGSDINGAFLQVEPRSAQPQKWVIEYTNFDKGYTIRAAQSGHYIAKADGLAQGTDIVAWKDKVGDSTSWMFIPYTPSQTVDNGKYVLVPELKDDMLLDIAGDTYDVSDGTNVQIWSDGAPCEFNTFEITHVKDGYYRVGLQNTDKVMEVQKNTAGPSNVQMGTYRGTDNQLWAFIRNRQGYTLVSRATGFVLDIGGEGTANGTNVQQFRLKGTPSQTWFLRKACYKIQYAGDGGVGEPDSQTMYYRNYVTLSSQIPARPGYVFWGWGAYRFVEDSDFLQYEYYNPGDRYIGDKDRILHALWWPIDGLRLPKATRTVGEEAFSGMTLEAVSIPEGCQYIRTRAFANCPNLRYVALPRGWISIASNAFENSSRVALYVYAGSTGESFAKQNGIKYIIVPDDWKMGGQ